MLVCHHSPFIENLKISRGFFELVLPQDLGFKVYGLWFFAFVLTQAVVKCIIKQQECKCEEQFWVILVLSCMSILEKSNKDDSTY
jgi:hypothetical protein